ncbi:Type 1 glutamine amidotransferase-like domain-containing protein [Psychrobacillus sp. FSL W7-1493]|uniref:Type 1 glutamine amidotransferase-like domain-containing protein n=1 Tax=Psychrobacillus sp. FSL W7-1493 TaxID=2921552 RepID=UPI0030FBE55D
MELCFIGGGHVLKGELDDVFEELECKISPNTKVLVVPFATDESRYESWMESLQQAFTRIPNVTLGLLHEKLSKEDMINMIEEYDVLYIIGGQPERLLQVILDKELTAAINSFPGLMIGYSAGALAFCTDCILTKDEDYPDTIILQGLGLVDFSVEVHYRPESDEELLTLSKDRTIYALPDGSAILYKNDTIHTRINEIITFKNGTKKKCFS